MPSLVRNHLMEKISPEECFRVLELDPSASPAEVRSAFRRLAKENHPDLNKSRRQRSRFQDIVQAYRVLQHEMNLHPAGADVRICPTCGRYKELLEGLDGRLACSDCLLGETRRKRHLPAPIWQTVKHLSVVVLYGASVILLIQSMVTGHLGYAAGSLACAVIGLVVLAVTVLLIRDVR